MYFAGFCARCNNDTHFDALVYVKFLIRKPLYAHFLDNQSGGVM